MLILIYGLAFLIPTSNLSLYSAITEKTHRKDTSDINKCQILHYNCQAWSSLQILPSETIYLYEIRLWDVWQRTEEVVWKKTKSMLILWKNGLTCHSFNFFLCEQNMSEIKLGLTAESNPTVTKNAIVAPICLLYPWFCSFGWCLADSQEYSSTHKAVGRSPWLVRPSGTHSATTCVIHISASPASIAYLRHICFSSAWCTERIRGTGQ